MSLEKSPRMFHIIRNSDESGVSGTGRVLDGVLFPNGKVVVQWRTDLDPLKAGFSSMTIFDSFTAFETIHISSHPTNKTEVIWEDELLEETIDELEKNKRLLNETRKKFREYKSEIEINKVKQHSTNEDVN